MGQRSKRQLVVAVAIVAATGTLVGLSPVGLPPMLQGPLSDVLRVVRPGDPVVDAVAEARWHMEQALSLQARGFSAVARPGEWWGAAVAALERAAELADGRSDPLAPELHRLVRDAREAHKDSQMRGDAYLGGLRQDVYGSLVDEIEPRLWNS